MNSDFKKRIRGNRDYFDSSQPDDGHLDRFIAKLDEVSKKKQKTQFMLILSKVAAVARPTRRAGGAVSVGVAVGVAEGVAAGMAAGVAAGVASAATAAVAIAVTITASVAEAHDLQIRMA